jgi:hypothetical protein
MNTDKKGASRRHGDGRKKPYRAPKLVVHGDIRTLTRTKSGSQNDGSGKPATRTPPGSPA